MVVTAAPSQGECIGDDARTGTPSNSSVHAPQMPCSRAEMRAGQALVSRRSQQDACAARPLRPAFSVEVSVMAFMRWPARWRGERDEVDLLPDRIGYPRGGKRLASGLLVKEVDRPPGLPRNNARIGMTTGRLSVARRTARQTERVDRTARRRSRWQTRRSFGTTL